jgi:hypothetical protein
MRMRSPRLLRLPTLGRMIFQITLLGWLFAAFPVYAQNAVSSNFDHDATGFPLTGTHRSVPCASCHINERYRNTPTRCFGCHNAINFPGLGSVFSHPATTNYCEGCHQTTTWRDYRFIDHTQALAPCASCHNGKLAAGKTPQHIVTSQPCDSCHFNTVTFKGGIVPPVIPSIAAPSSNTPASSAPAKPSHAGLSIGCANCHNGVAATGKPSSHIVTRAPCESCHKSSVTFAGARMNHAGIIANCATCHNGALAPGKPGKHVATNAPCETCHRSTVTFAGARIDHASLTGTCISCHNGTVADGKPAAHILTALSCDTCHRTRFWAPVTYRHTSPLFVNHGPGIACSGCHAANAQTVVWKFPAFKPGCAGCHADKFRPAAHVKFLRPVPFYYTVAELRDCTGACHTYADNTQRVVSTRTYGVHRAFGGGW